MLLAQAAGGEIPAERPIAPIARPSHGQLPPAAMLSPTDVEPVLLAQADPGVAAAAEKSAEQPAAEAPAAGPGDKADGKAAGDGGGNPQQKAPSGFSLQGMLVPMLAIGFLFYFLLIRPQRQEQRRRQAMLGGVKKNDRVVTIGGIYGVVTNVHREADEVTVKVDETTNTKLRVTLASIARIMGDEPSGGASSKP